MIISFLLIFKSVLEKRFLELRYDHTADISDFSSLLMQGVDPNICNEVRVMFWHGYVIMHLAKFKSKLESVIYIVQSQIAAVTVISYKPCTDLNFARYIQYHYGGCLSSSPLV